MKFMVEMFKFVDGLKQVLVMVIVQVAYAGLNVLYKLAASDGMGVRVIVAYRFIFATAFMVPLALFFERKTRPKLTWTILFQAFVCGLLGWVCKLQLSYSLFMDSHIGVSTLLFVSMTL